MKTGKMDFTLSKKNPVFCTGGCFFFFSSQLLEQNGGYGNTVNQNVPVQCSKPVGQPGMDAL